MEFTMIVPLMVNVRMEHATFGADITIFVFCRHNKVNGSILMRELLTERKKAQVGSVQLVNYTSITIYRLICKPKVDSSEI